MADYVLEKKSDITAIANAIRNKLNSADTMTVKDMPNLIEGIKTDGGTTVVGEYNVVLGQFVPSVPEGQNNIDTGIGTGTEIVFATIWLDDLSVKDKYSEDTIMVNSTRFNQVNATIQYFNNGTEATVSKHVFGIMNLGVSGGILAVTGHANWKLQPETYNYMAVYV